MKKFSKVTNQKINTEPKQQTMSNESDIFKYEIISLIDRLLKIRSYGSVDNRFLSGSVKIEGKEILADAILDLLQIKTKKEQTKILESLKTKIKDWETIDKSIEDIEPNKNITLNNKLRFNSILERYKDESLVIYIHNIAEKLNKESINDYIILTEKSNIKEEYKQKIINKLNSFK